MSRTTVRLRPRGEDADRRARDEGEEPMTRYMLLQNYEGGEGCDVPMDQWPPEDVKAHVQF
jgi:hypothetical protein